MDDKEFLVTVEKVRGSCRCSFKEGDKFSFRGVKTIEGFCGGAYLVIFPLMTALGFGARFNFNKNPAEMKGLACPSDAKVIFSIADVSE